MTMIYRGIHHWWQNIEWYDWKWGDLTRHDMTWHETGALPPAIQTSNKSYKLYHNINSDGDMSIARNFWKLQFMSWLQQAHDLKPHKKTKSCISAILEYDHVMAILAHNWNLIKNKVQDLNSKGNSRSEYLTGISKPCPSALGQSRKFVFQNGIW